MGTYLQILRFGSKYLRRYWLRFACGILLGSLFGVTNGLTMGSVYLVLSRLDTVQAYSPSAVSHHGSNLLDLLPGSLISHGRVVVSRVSRDLDAMIDPWLPKAKRPLDWKQLLGVLLVFPLVAGLRGVLNYATTYSLAWTGQRVANDIRVDTFRKISSLSLDFFHRHPTAELMHRVNDDAGSIYVCLRLGLSDLIKEPATIVVLLGALMLLNVKLTLIALCFAPLCIIPTRIVSRRIEQLALGDNMASVSQSAIVLETFQNVRITKAYCLESQQQRLFRISGIQSARAGLKTVQARGYLHPAVEILNSLGIGLVIVYAFWSAIPVAFLATFLVALCLFYQPCKKLSTIGVYFTQAKFALDRLLAIFQATPSVREIENPLSLPLFDKALEFRQVSFSYGDEDVLSELNLVIPRGKRLGIVGESGSGKTSLLNLLLRFYDPTSGRIIFDGISICDVRLTDLRQQIAFVGQDVQLFNSTVAQNIGFGKLGACREEIMQAACKASAHDFILALPLGYDTPLGEHGSRLSGGQRQRIAIARAFVRNAPILVLDEATASLDSASEAEVQRAINLLEENRTVLCVAHRLATLRSMDQIIVLQKGRIVESGTFSELLTRPGPFSLMATHQSIERLPL